MPAGNASTAPIRTPGNVTGPVLSIESSAFCIDPVCTVWRRQSMVKRVKTAGQGGFRGFSRTIVSIDLQSVIDHGRSVVGDRRVRPRSAVLRIHLVNTGPE